jgi:Na+-driven multidrug efflux pump
MFVLMQTTAAMRAVGEAAMPLLLLFGANVLNLLLCVVFLFGLPDLGIPAIGVVGAAYAAVASRTLGAVVALAWLRRRRHALTLRGDVPQAATGPVVWPLLRDAWPQAVQIGLRAVVFLGLTVLVQHRFGDAATAAIGLTTRFDTVVLFASLGFANAATAFAGRAVARGNERALRAAGLWAGVQAGALGALFVVLMVAFAEPLATLFVPHASPELRAMTTTYFGTAAWAQVFGAVALGAMGAVQGAGQMAAPLRVDLIGFLVVAALVLAAGSLAAPAGTVFLALTTGMAVLASLHLWFVRRGAWIPGP